MEKPQKQSSTTFQAPHATTTKFQVLIQVFLFIINICNFIAIKTPI